MRSHQDERGVTAIIIALTMTLLLCSAALAIDISNLNKARWDLQYTIDAAATAGAYKLPDDPLGAKADAIAYAKMNNPASNPTVNMYCVVASTGASHQILAGQIPAACDPGTTAGAICNDFICAIPCPATAKCNTMRVTENKDVPYYFAPAIGVEKGNTGAVTSVACKGACGNVLPNAMDVVVVADRTLSMSAGDLATMKSGIKGMLQVMTPELQSVALGTLHRAKATGSHAPSCYSAQGPWVSTGFSSSYLNAPVNGNRSLKNSDQLVDMVTWMYEPGIPLSGSGDTWSCPAYGSQGTNTGTNLAAAMQGAYRALLARPNSDSSRGGAVRKVIIFETDGMPDETLPLQTNVSATDPSGGPQVLKAYNTQTAAEKARGGTKGCELLRSMAAVAKSQGYLVVTIGYGSATTAGCNKITNTTSDGPSVRSYLADSASPAPDGSPSAANLPCSTENGDGDFYFCAANAAQLAPIFTTVINQVSTSIRLIQLPT